MVAQTHIHRNVATSLRPRPPNNLTLPFYSLPNTVNNPNHHSETTIVVTMFLLPAILLSIATALAAPAPNPANRYNATVNNPPLHMHRLLLPRELHEHPTRGVFMPYAPLYPLPPTLPLPLCGEIENTRKKRELGADAKQTMNMQAPYIKQVSSAGPDKGTFCTLYSCVPSSHLLHRSTSLPCLFLFPPSSFFPYVSKG
jgi:hypothetical protein